MTVFEALTKVMADVEPISKGRKNSQQGFMYRGIDDVMNELQPIFSKHKVFVVPEVLEQTREERTTKNGGLLIYTILKIKYTFYSEDGTSISAVVIGEGMDSADKSSNKAMAVGMKYALLQVLCIPTEDDKDPDGHSPNPAPKKAVRNTPKNEPKNDGYNLDGLVPPPEEERLPWEMGVEEYYCQACGEKIDKRVNDWSRKNYGMALCRECQKKQ